jgi:hypothetical protein
MLEIKGIVFHLMASKTEEYNIVNTVIAVMKSNTCSANWSVSPPVDAIKEKLSTEKT